MDERKKEMQEDVLISDKRHTRDVNDEISEEEQLAVEDALEAPQSVDVPSTEQVAPVVEEKEPTATVVDFPGPKRDDEAPQAAATTQDTPDGQTAVPPDEDSPEAQQVRLLFEAGITGYLHGQFDLLFTFALIYLGRRPNPATGLTATDLKKARLAIDMLAFIFTNTQEELPQQDRAALANLLSSLKVDYSQASGSNAPQTPTDEGQA